MSAIAFEIQPRPTLAAAKSLLAAGQLPTSDLTEEHCRSFFFVGVPELPLGIVGLELFSDVALLRSLVVRSGHQHSGFGSALVDHAEAYARRNGVRALFLLTTTAQSFFEKHGYANTPREAAPDAIKATPEFAGICPASSAFMTKTL